MTPARWSALCRAWHRKTRRPVPGVAVTLQDVDAFLEMPREDDANGQRAFVAALEKRKAAHG